MPSKVVRRDSKGRISLGSLANGVSSFEIIETKDHRIILEPQVEISAREKWLFDNKEALKKVKKGLQDAAEGRLSEKGKFNKPI